MPGRLHGVCAGILLVFVGLCKAHLHMGAVRLPKNDGYSFRMWVPHANGVKVELKEPSAKAAKVTVDLVRRTENGNPNIWFGECKEAELGQEYRVCVESSWNDCFQDEGAIIYRRDPYSRYATKENFHDTWCRLTDNGEDFEWSQKEQPWLLKNGLGAHSLYEMHLGTYTHDGTFLAAADKLEHIASLGFSCIELMPTTEYGGSWGYNPRSCLAIHSPYGTPDDFRKFVDKAHSLGIAVMVDIVLNHGSARFNCLWNWDGYAADGQGGIYFDKGGGDTPWGRKFAFDRPEVQEYLMDACRMYLSEYRCDGLRFDSAHNMPDWLVGRMCHQIKSEYPGGCLTAEVVPEDPRCLVGGQGFDAIWLHGPCFDVIDGVSGAHDMWIPKIRAMIRQKYFPRAAAETGINALLGSHDQVGCRKNGGRNSEGRLGRYFIDRVGGRDDWTARCKARMWWAAAAAGVVSGVPMMFQGTETLQPQWWHLDKKFRWDLAPEIDGESGCSNARQMMKLVRATLLLRKHHPYLVTNQPDIVHFDEENMVIAVKRGHEYLAVFHPGGAQWGDGSDRYGIHVGETVGGKARQLLNTQAEEFGGWDGSWTTKGEGFDMNLDNGKIWIKIPKWSVSVYQFGK